MEFHLKITSEAEEEADRRIRDAIRKKYKTENPNVVPPRGKLTVFQEILRKPNSGEEIRWCKENGADLYSADDTRRYPIIHLVDSMSPENFEAFLENFDKTQINVKFDGMSSLHYLVEMFENVTEPNEFDKICECVKILVKAGCDPNEPDGDNKTPFFYLLKAKSLLDPTTHKDLVNFVLVNSKVDAYTCRSKEIIKMMTNQGFAIPEKLEVVVNANFMKNQIEIGNCQVFLQKFQEFKDRYGSELSSNSYENDSLAGDTVSLLKKTEISSDDYQENCAIFLCEATKKGLLEIVEFLVAQGVDINRRPKSCHPAAFVACQYGQDEILEIFLDHTNEAGVFDLDVNFEGKNLLHEVCSHFGFFDDAEEAERYKKCFDLLLEAKNLDKMDVNQQDELGLTPLYYAIRYKNDEATKALLKKSYIGKRDVFDKIQIHNIDKDVFEEFLNNCVSHEVNETTGEQKFTVDFSFLVAPKSAGEDFAEEISPLEAIVNNKELRELILHPVLSTFLFLKWIKLSILFYTNLIFFSFFMGSFITYIVLHKSDLFFGLSMFFATIMIMREAVQWFLSYKTYFRSKMNWFELLFTFLVLVVLLETQFKGIHDNLASAFGPKTLKIIKGVAILCATYEILVLFGDLPNFSVSTHMVMFRKVLMTFMKFIGLYSILLVGFAFCFYTLFGEDENEEADNDEDFHNFKYPGFAIIKTIVMFSGELEASNIKLMNNDPTYSIIFVMFVFLISITLLNLINGLSVSDVFQIKAEGHLIDLCQKIHVLNKYEQIIICERKVLVCLKRIISIFPEFVTNGRIEIDEYGVTRLGAKAVDPESTFEKCYNRLFKFVQKHPYSLLKKNDKKLSKKNRKTDGVQITIDSSVVKKFKELIEQKNLRRKKREEFEKIGGNKEKLKMLSGMDEKLELILRALKEKA